MKLTRIVKIHVNLSCVIFVECEFPWRYLNAALISVLFISSILTPILEPACPDILNT